ncbi:MAG: hypothetical protein AMXMBFR84_50490 [Candidatus Hydrogenedentota bacterium]
MGGWFKRHKILTGFALFILLGWAFMAWRMWGPYRGYEVDFIETGNAEEADTGFQVGVAKRDITPDLSKYDTWTDANNDAKFREKDGDTWQDRNGNGKMDLVWMGGFSNNRPAKGVNDPLWARAIAVRNNGVTVVMVAIDSVGMTHHRFIPVRKAVNPSLNIDHIILATTHSHEAPDTMGIWSYKIYPPLFDTAYMAFIQEQARAAIEEAVGALRPAEMILQEKTVEANGWVRDSRKPLVYDHKVCMARFVERGTDITIATLVSWGNHPESMGSDNSFLSSDYPHYFRQGVEKGVAEPNGATGLGGTCVFFSGPLGGLMNPLHIPYTHRDGTTVVEKNGIEKAEILGANLALLTINALREEGLERESSPHVAVAARTVYTPINGLFTVPIVLGLLHPGYFWGKAKTEVNMVRIGGLEILTIPGEIYPEIVDGGVESPEGADFGGAPLEVPPLRSVMKGKVNMVFNLANDEIGYIVPKSQWDTKPPFTYGEDDAPYGEENSGGFNVAPSLHGEAIKLMADFHEALGEPDAIARAE